MKKKTKILLLATFLLAAMTVYIMLQTPLTVVRYEIETNFTETIRIVHLTDLHGWSHGENNRELIQLVKDQNPDLILMTGDMMDREEEGPEVVCGLIAALKEKGYRLVLATNPLFPAVATHSRIRFLDTLVITHSTQPSRRQEECINRKFRKFQLNLVCYLIGLLTCNTGIIPSIHLYSIASSFQDFRFSTTLTLHISRAQQSRDSGILMNSYSTLSYTIFLQFIHNILLCRNRKP